MVVAESLTFTHLGRTVIADASLRMDPGTVSAVLGPNGAGKSTLLRLLSGELRASSGRVALNGRPIHAWKPKELARQRSVLPQSESLRFAFDARAVVALGRYPWGDADSDNGHCIVDRALRATGIEALAARHYTQLSAGERARVQLSRVLAQVWEPSGDLPRALFLDEPTAHLDLAHQHDVLAAVRHFAAGGVAVLIVLHDLNLALNYADRAILLRAGRIVSSGAPCDVLTTERIRDVFDIQVERLQRANGAPWFAAHAPGDQTKAAP